MKRLLVALAFFPVLYVQNAIAQDRYSPSIRVIHAQQFIEVTSLLQQGRTADAWAKFQQYAVNMGHLGGALDSQMPGMQPPPPPSAIIDMPWPEFRRMELPNFGDQTIAFRLVVPVGTPPSTQGGYTSIFEYRGPPSLRHMTLSKVPGDFREVDPTGVTGPMAQSGGVQASIFWTVGVGTGPTLVAGGTYYFNVRNTNADGRNLPAMVETNWPQ